MMIADCRMQNADLRPLIADCCWALDVPCWMLDVQRPQDVTRENASMDGRLVTSP